MRFTLAPAITAALLMAAQPALSQPASTAQPSVPPPLGSTTVDEVVVTASRPGEAVRDFVAGVSRPVPGERQLARWDRVICPGVAGMRGRYARLLNDRIAVAALRVGLEPGEPGCRANILIFATADSDSLARDIVENNMRLVSFYGEEGNTRGRAALREFENTPRPVRWWHVTQTTTNDGVVAGRGSVIEVRGSGRIRRNTRQDFNRVIIVLDMRRAESVPFGALADYVAMIALAQLEPGAETAAFPTVLNLFGERPAGTAAPTGLTDWDYAYLLGLYGARRNANTFLYQQQQIADSMRTDRPAEPQQVQRR